MLLILTNHEDVTADYLAGLLNANDVPFLRFNTDVSLADAAFRYAQGQPRLRLGGEWHSPSKFTNIWYRRPERLKLDQDDESPDMKVVLDEWSDAIDGFLAHIPFHRWMNHPAANVGASYKVEQLTTACQLGFTTPHTLITQEPEEVREFFNQHHENVIVKPISVGYIEREDGETDSVIYTNAIAKHHLDNLDDLAACPTFFQERINKAVDIRITVVDRDIHAVRLIAQENDGSQRCDVRRNNMDDVVYQQVNLPTEVENGIRKLMEHYRLRFAAIDMAMDQDGRWVFFEINPNGQWAWLDLVGAVTIGSSFVRSFSIHPDEAT